MQLTRRHCASDFESQNENGNHTLVEDTEKQTEKFCPWKKPSKDRKQVPQKPPGVLNPKKNDISVTSDSHHAPAPQSMSISLDTLMNLSSSVLIRKICLQLNWSLPLC